MKIRKGRISIIFYKLNFLCYSLQDTVLIDSMGTTEKCLPYLNTEIEILEITYLHNFTL